MLPLLGNRGYVWAWMGVLCLSAASGLAVEPFKVPNATAKTAEEMKAYTDQIPGTEIKFDVVPIRGGKFLMGSPEDEEGRKDDEGPQHEVQVDSFWMGKCEVTWDEYEQWMLGLELDRRKFLENEPTELDKLADIVIRPTKPYTDMTFGMGHKGYPAICMTQHAAIFYCKWLSAKTGRYYRLPTEAEWEYACRAGTKTAYFFGDDPARLDDYAWYIDNSDFVYHPVGKKKPSPWGLHDIHGNVAEWVIDEYRPNFYAKFKDKVAKNPVALAKPEQEYSHVVRGGSWDDEADMLRSAARRGSNPDWKIQDPQIPQSIWYHTDALFVGFRVVRPLNPPKNWREELAKEMEKAQKQKRDKQ